MSRENVEIVRAVMAYQAGDAEDDAFLERYFHPDVEWDLTHRSFDPRIYHGHEGIREWNDQLSEAWAEWRSEPEEFLESGDQVVVLVRAYGRGRVSGLELVEKSASVVTLRDGKVSRMKVYLDREQALRDAGIER
jgi:ketosteroid isomerase-like protein